MHDPWVGVGSRCNLRWVGSGPGRVENSRNFLPAVKFVHWWRSTLVRINSALQCPIHNVLFLLFTMHTSRACHVYKTLHFLDINLTTWRTLTLYLKIQVLASSWVGQVGSGRVQSQKMDPRTISALPNAIPRHHKVHSNNKIVTTSNSSNGTTNNIDSITCLVKWTSARHKLAGQHS